MALATALDLTGAGDGTLLAAEAIQILAAGVVETPRELVLQPGVEIRVGLDGELAHQ